MSIFNVFTLMGGIAMFLYGMDLMGKALEQTAGSKLQGILSKMTASPVRGLLLGMVITAVIQSSGATTVMAVGFVNSGLMELHQAIGVIMGANIGTTVTGWLLSLSGLEGDSFATCSLCAKLRRGSLNTALTDLGIRKIALGHHYDDAIETLLMNLLFEGRIGCFQPVTYLDRTGITQIRPLLYCREEEIRWVARRLELPVVENPCPANGHSRRQEVKELIAGLEGRYPDIKQKLFGSLQRYPLYGWNLHEEER